eukprot:9524134-Lingulodinium_polyedra.AAC.1
MDAPPLGPWSSALSKTSITSFFRASLLAALSLPGSKMRIGAAGASGQCCITACELAAAALWA